jgi:hypothetical protein
MKGPIQPMTKPGTSLFSTLCGARSAALAALALASMLLAACNGTAVVTMTSTASQDNFLAYRVGLVSVELETSSGTSGLKVLPASTTVDFSTLTDISEVLGAAAVKKGSYTSALITLDYSSAEIIYDDGSTNGVSLSPVGVNGQALGQVQLTVDIDPSNRFSVSSKGASQLALEFNLAASNVVNLTAKTVTVTPLMAASALPIDSKQVRIRGPLVSAANSSTATAATTDTTDTTATVDTSFTMGVMPFNSATTGAGNLVITAGDSTEYEINGSPSIGSGGQTQLAGLGTGTLTVAYGTLASSDAVTTTTTAEGTTTTSSATNVTFTATQVLAGSSVQGAGLDRVTGTVLARSGNVLSVEDATLVANDGTESFLGGTTLVNLGPNTLVTEFGQDITEISPQQISVGSSIDAFGVVDSVSGGNAILDASAGRVRLDTTTASGLVTGQGTSALNLNLATLGGRAVGAFDFFDTGASAGQYVVSITGGLDLSNSTVGAPVIVSGLTSPFGSAAPNFTATALLDPTTINAELMVDWGTGTAAPFTTYDTTAIDLDIHNSSIGARHQIQVGAQLINIIALSSDPQISPNGTSSNTVFTIGHAATATMENFNTYAAFITQLQSELNGTVLATGMTAVGQYTVSGSLFSATSITLFLNN